MPFSSESITKTQANHITKSFSHVNSSWNGRRIVFFVIGLVLVPIILRIVAWLIEKFPKPFLMSWRKENSLFPFPDQPPVPSHKIQTVIPQVELIKYQKRETDVCQYWPKDLTLLGLTEKEKNSLAKHIKNAFRYKGCLNNRALEYDDGMKITVKGCIALGFDKASKRLFLFPKKVFAEGGERTIRWAYELTKGQFYLKKRIVGLFEKQILTMMHNLRNARNIPSEILWRSLETKYGSQKDQIVEPIRDGDLTILYEQQPLASFPSKCDLILDLLKDLEGLHRIRLEKMRITRGEGQKKAIFTFPPFFAFHSDIKPENILVFNQNHRWRAILSDFGAASANPLKFISSFGFTPPEYIRYWQIYQDACEWSDFNIKYGQKRDIWSFGLVILIILKGGAKKKESPLPSLGKCLKLRDSSGKRTENGILNLTQNEINKDLSSIEESMTQNYPSNEREIKSIFCILEQSLLRIEPDERQSASYILKFCRNNNIKYSLI